MLTTATMNPALIELHDLDRDITAVLDDYEDTGYSPDLHIRHDRLNVIVLRAVAAGNPHSPALASLMLRLEDVGYTRWYE